jgi:protein SCO1/2
MSRLRQLAVTIALFGVVGCTRGSAPSGATTEGSGVTASSPEVSISIYPLEVQLRDQNDAAIGVDVFRGHTVIVSMFFGSCPAACPLLVSHIARLEASLAPEVRSELRVLLVSFDAERDTPARLGELARAHKADPARWRLASATDEPARVLGNALGISFRKIEGGMFAHDSVITVLDGDGRIVARNDDLTADVTPLGLVIDNLGRRHE